MLEDQGQPLPRVKGQLPPCRVAGWGCAKGTPENSRSLTEQNVQAVQHYRECRAVGCFPDDDIVRQTAALIRETEEQFRRWKEEQWRTVLVELATLR